MASKYPWIPKSYYPAVMLACKIIREDGTFNRAIRIAADYYDVDEDEVERHVRARQRAGQKGSRKGKRYSWFVVVHIVETDAWGIQKPTLDNCEVVRGLTKSSVSRRFDDSDFKATRRRDYGGSYAPVYWTVVSDACPSKQEAIEHVGECLERVRDGLGGNDA